VEIEEEKVEKVGVTPETSLIEIRGETANIEVRREVEPGVIEYRYTDLPYRPVGELWAENVVKRVIATPSFTKIYFDGRRKCTVERVEVEGIEPYYRIVCTKKR